jgi:hypothetical protein
VEFPVIPDAGVINQEVNVEVLMAEPFTEGNAFFLQGEVGSIYANIEFWMDPAQVGGNLLKAVIPAGHQNQALGIGSQLGGKFEPKTRGGSSNQCAATFVKFHHSRFIFPLGQSSNLRPIVAGGYIDLSGSGGLFKKDARF